jgi:AAA domain
VGELVAAGGGDENSAKDVGPIFASLQRIKDETGVHAALIGHTGKNSDRGVRGSSAVPGDIDVGIAIDGDAIKTATESEGWDFVYAARTTSHLTARHPS